MNRQNADAEIALGLDSWTIEYYSTALFKTGWHALKVLDTCSKHESNRFRFTSNHTGTRFDISEIDVELCAGCNTSIHYPIHPSRIQLICIHELFSLVSSVMRLQIRNESAK